MDDRSSLAASARSLTFSYTSSDGRTTTALKDVNLDVKRGSRVLLVGCVPP